MVSLNLGLGFMFDLFVEIDLGVLLDCLVVLFDVGVLMVVEFFLVWGFECLRLNIDVSEF